MKQNFIFLKLILIITMFVMMPYAHSKPSNVRKRITNNAKHVLRCHKIVIATTKGKKD